MVYRGGMSHLWQCSTIDKPSQQQTSATPTSSTTTTPTNEPGVDTGGKKSARESSFTTKEDENLCQAWLRVSEDSITSSDQKGDAFYQAIAEYYESIKPAYCSAHNSDSIRRRLKKILSDCVVFSGCVEKISNCKPSRATEEDALKLDLALFNKPLGAFWGSKRNPISCADRSWGKRKV